jgi:hypothetical protein
MPAPKIVQTLLQPVRLLLGSLFTRRYRGPELDARIAFAAELKCLDANMRPGEIVRLQRLAKKRAPG